MLMTKLPVLCLRLQEIPLIEVKNENCTSSLNQQKCSKIAIDGCWEGGSKFNKLVEEHENIIGQVSSVTKT